MHGEHDLYYRRHDTELPLKMPMRSLTRWIVLPLVALAAVVWFANEKESLNSSGDAGGGVASRHSLPDGSTMERGPPESGLGSQFNGLDPHSASVTPSPPSSGPITPTHIMARASSASEFIAQIRSIPPSALAWDLLQVAELACSYAARQHQSNSGGASIASDLQRSHQEQVDRLIRWCGDREAIRQARLELTESLKAANVSLELYEDLFGADGSIPPERLSEALDELFKAPSLSAADGLASQIYELTGGPMEGIGQAESIIGGVRWFRVAHLASAMIYCRQAELCAPNHPRTMLECLEAHLCAPDRSLLDLRWTLANDVERELAQRMVAKWVQLRSKPNGG